jgi:hypothetical protein
VLFGAPALDRRKLVRADRQSSDALTIAIKPPGFAGAGCRPDSQIVVVITTTSAEGSKRAGIKSGIRSPAHN